MRRSDQKLNAVAGALSNRLVGQSPTRSYLFFRHPNQTPADIFNKSSFVSCWDIMKRALRKKVLLVDDSRIVRERLGALISELPSVELVGEASNVAEGIRKIRRLRPDIVVLDISMPDGNG